MAPIVERGARYRWLLVVALATIVNVGYGTIFYSFSVLLGEGAAAGEFSRTLLSASLGLGVVASGILAPLVGTLCDISGPRRVFIVGAALGAAGLAAFSRATEGWQIIVAWLLLLGPAMAATFYEPAYVAIDQWFEGPQGRPLGVLTLVAGLSVTIFVPLTQWLVERFEWRDATLVLGMVLLAVVWTLSLLIVRDRPQEDAEVRHLDLRAIYKSMLDALNYTNRTFWIISAAFFLGLAATFALLFHQVAYLQDLGFPPGQIAAAVGVIGVISLPGRFLLPALGNRVPIRLLIAVTFGLLAVAGLLPLGAREWWRVYLYIVLFGTVFGAVLPMRAVIMSRHFSGPLYGRLMGLQQSMLAVAIAGGPFVAGALRDASGSYTVPWLAFSLMFITAVPVILAVRR
jgi:MFS family permease